MQLQPVDLIGAFYADDSRLWSSQDCVNWLPTVAQQKGTRTEMKLATPPGLSYFTQCGDGPIRGARDVEGKLFVVSGNELFEVAYDGTPTLRGTIPGVGLVSMSHNKRGYGNQLLIVNGDAGYVWDTSAATLTRITDTGYPGSVQVDYLDHYLIQVEPWGRFWFHSNLDNATDYNTLDQYDAEASPDKMIGIAANQLEAVVFSQKTIEFFANTGATTGTFQSKRIVIERGCASRNTIVKLDNTLMWLGNDGIFYRLNGYGAQPISTGPIHRAIASLNWANAFGFVWEDKGYKVAYWTFPDGQTWGYDATQPPGYQWHRRESYGLNRWRLNTCTNWQKRWVGGDYRTGVLYLVDWLAQHEMGQPLVSERTGGTANANQNAVICPYVEFLFDTGGPAWDGDSGLPPELSITGDLPDGEGGDVESYQYESAGGVQPHTFSILSGELPAGLSMSTAGLVTGTRTTAGTYSWVVRVTDADGSTADLSDSSVTSADSTPVLTGTYQMQMNLSVGVDGAAIGVVPRGAWKLIIGEVNHTTGQLALYSDGVLLDTSAETVSGVLPYDLAVAGTAYSLDDTYQAFRGRLWGVGVANGLLTAAEKSVLWNGGDGISFASLASSIDPDAVSLWAKIIYAWQLNNLSTDTYVDSKGNRSLTKFGTVGHVIDAKFGICLNGTKAGRLVAVGSNAQGLESAVSATYFAWVFSEVLSTDDNPAILSRHNGGTDIQGLRSYWLSD
jgi:hypothetical protein